MNDRSTLLLEHHLKELKLPSFLREYGKMAAQCAARQFWKAGRMFSSLSEPPTSMSSAKDA